jgi:hypothetical protein
MKIHKEKSGQNAVVRKQKYHDHIPVCVMFFYKRQLRVHADYKRT